MVRWLSLILTGFSALTAIGGGIAMLLGLDKFPPQWLEGTPFKTYRIPALILVCVVGGSSAVAFVAILLRSPLASTFTVAAGAIMMGWISGEVQILK